MNILLIAGHGGGDPGAVCGNLQEAELTRALCHALTPRLKTFSQVTLFDTSKNMYRYLKNGGTFDFSPYDYILEIHFNAGAKKLSDNTTTGTEILVHEKEKGVSVEENILAQISDLGYKCRGVKRRSNLYNMNRANTSGKSYALLEVCFLDDADDMAIYNSEKVAEKIAEGIKKGFGISCTPSPATDESIVHLAGLGIITNKDLWQKKMGEDTNVYYLIKKVSRYIKTGKV